MLQSDALHYISHFLILQIPFVFLEAFTQPSARSDPAAEPAPLFMLIDTISKPDVQPVPAPEGGTRAAATAHPSAPGRCVGRGAWDTLGGNDSLSGKSCSFSCPSPKPSVEGELTRPAGAHTSGSPWVGVPVGYQCGPAPSAGGCACARPWQHPAPVPLRCSGASLPAAATAFGPARCAPVQVTACAQNYLLIRVFYTLTVISAAR